MTSPVFVDRRDAGRKLAAVLAPWPALRGPVAVLGLARGGVPVAYEVAHVLHAPLDVMIVRKVGVPGHEEFAMGAIASGGVRIVNDDVIQSLGISADTFEQVAARETRELERREQMYRAGEAPMVLVGHAVIVADDGVATGASMLAAVAAVRQLRAHQVIVATPLIGSSALARLQEAADDVVALASLDDMGSVGAGYADFRQTGDDEVRALLARRKAMVPS